MIKIHGKDYITVAERVTKAHENKDLQIITEMFYEGDNIVRCKATVKLGERIFTGHAEELRDDKSSMVNRTSAVENCETSAIGRALGFAGIGVVDGIATADEVKIAQGKAARGSKCPVQPVSPPEGHNIAQKGEIIAKVKILGFEPKKDEWGAVIKSLTQLDLVEENYAAILDRLDAKINPEK